MSLGDGSKTYRVQLLQGKPPGSLLLHEIYRSIQGESTFAGLPCAFVRLAVCDSRCQWCDTPHAFNQGTLQSPEEVLQRVRAYDCPLVEITGGEPLLQEEVFPLMSRLADEGRTVLLETSGAHDLARVDPRVHASRRDFDWAAATVRAHQLERRLIVLFSPVFGSVPPVELAEWLLASGLQVRMQLQLHKYIWDPHARGV